MKFMTSSVCIASVTVLLLAMLTPFIHLLKQTYFCKCGKISFEDTSRSVEGNKKLIIGILSAREHFEERETIRKTWLQDIIQGDPSGEVLYKFVIGSKGCGVHPENRLDQYSCEKVNFTYDENFDYQNFQLVSLKEGRETDISFSQFSVIWNTSLIVRYPVIVKRLGLLVAVKLSQQPVIVQLYDENTEDVVLSAKFSTMDPGIVEGTKSDALNYRFQSVSHIFLPKGYVCSLRILNNGEKNLQIPMPRSLVSRKNDGGALELIPIDEKGFYTHTKSENNLFIGNLVISIDDKDRFKALQENESQLEEENKARQNEISLKLESEKNSCNDMVFVNVTDTYRNLPLKLLYFHQWVQSELHVQFVLKTDDDCFVNVNNILAELHALPRQGKVWWGNFRDNWFVERFGKWAEKMYRASEYPSFACGSGNVVSNDISAWLARHVEFLFPYQGEDTSMGIWLSALGPTYVENKSWLCEKDCEKNAFVVPQLSTEEMQLLWKNKLECDNICGCR